jgi:hypothetical protein
VNDDTLPDAPLPRFASRGRAFVYVLPCRDEDILKVGFSRDPLQRLHTLHRRFFRFFDLDRALLIEADRVRDARRIERRFITWFAEERAVAPLVVRDAAAGYTEWYRGVHAEVDTLARLCAAENGFALHAPLRAWLRDTMSDRTTLLYPWSERVIEAIEEARVNAIDTRERVAIERALIDTLDFVEELGLDIEPLVTERAFSWYRNNRMP